jgi:hypothetical protein
MNYVWNYILEVIYIHMVPGNVCLRTPRDSLNAEKNSPLKSTIFWDITTCSLLNVNRRFGETYRLHLQGRWISMLLWWFLARLIRRPWRWRRYFSPKHRLRFNGLHGVIPQNILLFITTSLRTSNPTKSPLIKFRPARNSREKSDKTEWSNTKILVKLEE